MRTSKPLLFQLFGTIINGDFGPYTMYTSHRRRFVIFHKTWPKDPATYHQNLNRNRWRQAGERWRNLPEPTKALWRTLAARNHCTVTGYNLFIYYMIDKDRRTIETLQRIARIDVINATGPPLPWPLA